MKKLIAIFTIAVFLGLTAYTYSQVAGGNLKVNSLSHTLVPVSFLCLTNVSPATNCPSGIAPPQQNGTLAFCSNCSVANTCAATGGGALAQFNAGGWNCNVGGGPGGGPSGAPGPAGPTGSPGPPGTFLINGTAVPATASPISFFGVNGVGSPTFFPTPTPWAVNGSFVPATASPGSYLVAGAGGTPLWTATPGGTATAAGALAFGTFSPVPLATRSPAPQEFLYSTAGIMGGHTIVPSDIASPLSTPALPGNFTSLLDSALTAGNCVQTTTGGSLTTTGNPCPTSAVSPTPIAGLPSCVPALLGTYGQVTDQNCGNITFNITPQPTAGQGCRVPVFCGGAPTGTPTPAWYIH